MELFGVILSILATLTLVILLRRAFDYRRHLPFYQTVRRLFKRKTKSPPEPQSRMLVAVRRRRAGRTNLSALEEQDHQAFLQRISVQIEQLCADWVTIAAYECGFHGADYGLPSRGEDNWMLFACFVVPDYGAFRSCLAALESDRYLLLRDHCEIRLLFGEKMTELAAHVNELF